MNKREQLAINTIRSISVDAIQKATSGHPGLPLGAATIGYTLFAEHLKHNPKNPLFTDRDRFVLSAGHGSMLLYSLFHLFGYDISIDDIKNFRQLGSKTPGHPEYGHTVGVETSTGPLGQGIANAVGMAIAEAHLAEKFNRPSFNVVDHYTYAFSGDGCMMEGIEYEAASLAGTLGLNKLIVLYDKNNITIEGDINSSFTEDVGARHASQGWHVQYVKDGNSVKDISEAISKAKAEKNKPSLVIIQTRIGFGSPLENSADCHGAPLGEKNIDLFRKNLGWSHDNFVVPTEVYEYMQEVTAPFSKKEEEWNQLIDGYKAKYPELYQEFTKQLNGELPDIKTLLADLKFTKADATRGTSSVVLNKLAQSIPNLMGGSADLGPSNKSVMNGRDYFSKENRLGTNMHFGIREHAMGAIVNGMYLHGGIRPYCSTFFVFSDYMKNAMRMASLMSLPIPYILTHDSIGVGEDGPTHQPIEQLIGLRSIPNMKVFRPCDGKETVAGWISALEGKQPTSLVLSRQNLPCYENTNVDSALKGGYILSECDGNAPDVILISCGSEIEQTMQAKDILKQNGISARVVSMPCQEEFDSQPLEYREKVLPKAIKARVAVEAGSSYSWHKYIGLDGDTVCIDKFGASAKPEVLFKLYGFTPENIASVATKVFKNCK